MSLQAGASQVKPSGTKRRLCLHSDQPSSKEKKSPDGARDGRAVPRGAGLIQPGGDKKKIKDQSFLVLCIPENHVVVKTKHGMKNVLARTHCAGKEQCKPCLFCSGQPSHMWCCYYFLFVCFSILKIIIFFTGAPHTEKFKWDSLQSSGLLREPWQLATIPQWKLISLTFQYYTFINFVDLQFIEIQFMEMCFI